MTISVIYFPEAVLRGLKPAREMKPNESQEETVRFAVDLPRSGGVLGFALDGDKSDCEQLSVESLRFLPAGTDLVTKGSIPGLMCVGAPTDPPAYTPFAEAFQLTGQSECTLDVSNLSLKEARVSAFLVVDDGARTLDLVLN